MRSPGLMVIATILNWIAFVAALGFQFLWPWTLFGGYNPSLYGITFFLLLISALLQTLFLVRNMCITFPPPTSSGPPKKPSATRTATPPVWRTRWTKPSAPNCSTGCWRSKKKTSGTLVSSSVAAAALQPRQTASLEGDALLSL